MGAGLLQRVRVACAGTSAAWLGAVPAALLGGLGVVAVWMGAFPRLRQVDEFEEAAEARDAHPPAEA